MTGSSTCDWRAPSICCLMAEADLAEQVLPAGRLREPLEAAARADALLVTGRAQAGPLASRVGAKQSFVVRVRLSATATGDAVRCSRCATAASGRRRCGDRASRAVGGRRAGTRLRGRRADHVPRSSLVHAQKTWRRCRRSRAGYRADAILTTEKDAVRLESMAAGPIPMMFLPIDARYRTRGTRSHAGCLTASARRRCAGEASAGTAAGSQCHDAGPAIADADGSRDRPSAWPVGVLLRQLEAANCAGEPEPRVSVAIARRDREHRAGDVRALRRGAARAAEVRHDDRG